MTNLFSPKQIVGICFLIIGLSVYLTTGFNFDLELPTLMMPDLNPFRDPCEGCTGFKRQIMLDSKPFNSLMENQGEKGRQALVDRKTLVDIADCTNLINMYRDNPAWTIKPYVAYKIIEVGCEV